MRRRRRQRHTAPTCFPGKNRRAARGRRRKTSYAVTAMPPPARADGDITRLLAWVSVHTRRPTESSRDPMQGLSEGRGIVPACGVCIMAPSLPGLDLHGLGTQGSLRRHLPYPTPVQTPTHTDHCFRLAILTPHTKSLSRLHRIRDRPHNPTASHAKWT